MLDEPNVTQERAKEIMQKAYCYFATIPSKGLGDGVETVRSRWADLVNEATTKHSRYLSDMLNGVFYETIDKDPRDSKAPDEKTDIASIPGAIKSGKTFLDEKRHVTPVAAGTDKFINKFVKKAQDIRERHKEENSKKDEEETALTPEVIATEDTANEQPVDVKTLP